MGIQPNGCLANKVGRWVITERSLNPSRSDAESGKKNTEQRWCPG